MKQTLGMTTEETILDYLVYEKDLNNEFKNLVDGNSFNPRITAVNADGSKLMIVVENCMNRENILQVKKRIDRELKKKDPDLVYQVLFPHSGK